MQGKTKIMVVIISVLALFCYFLPLFYDTLNYSPSIEEGQPYRRSEMVWSAFTNQRVTLNTELPQIPVNQLPIYKGRSSSGILNVSFSSPIGAYNSCNEDICFLIDKKEIIGSRINSTSTLAGFQPVKFIDINDSDEFIIQQIRNKNFFIPQGEFQMVSLGRTRIVDIKFIYFNGFDQYPYRYSGKTIYYPAWKLTVETSNYGNTELIVKAFQSDANIYQ
jgi:hypothetical protein